MHSSDTEHFLTLTKLRTILANRQAAQVRHKVIDEWTATAILRFYDCLGNITKTQLLHHQIDHIANLATNIYPKLRPDVVARRMTKQGSQSNISDLLISKDHLH